MNIQAPRGVTSLSVDTTFLKIGKVVFEKKFLKILIFLISLPSGCKILLYLHNNPLFLFP